ncbi:hypothetical protein GmHk_17G049377 [Glycine max]|nr:hypothetical protein GmHk_17G049377 [Glycine max]
MFVIIKKGENVNVCIHDFDDVKEESNKAASNDKHLLQEQFKIASTNKALFQDSLKTKHCLKTKCFQDMQGSGNRLPRSVIDYQKTGLRNSY